MSARICIDHGETIESISVGWNVELSTLGKILLNDILILQDAEKLINDGNIYRIYQTITYRTRGNKDIYTKRDDYSLEDLYNHLYIRCYFNIRENNYMYMWKDNKWFYAYRSTQYLLRPLTNRNTRSK